MTKPNGYVYRGDWKNGQATGDGEIKYSDGNHYIGEVLD